MDKNAPCEVGYLHQWEASEDIVAQKRMCRNKLSGRTTIRIERLSRRISIKINYIPAVLCNDHCDANAGAKS